MQTNWFGEGTPVKQRLNEFAKQAEEANNNSTICSFIAAFYNQPPDLALVTKLRSQTATSRHLLLNEKSIPTPIREGLAEMIRFLAEVQDRPDQEIANHLSNDWVRLFRGVGPGYGPPPPYEGVYRSKDGIGTDLVFMIQEIYTNHGIGLDENVCNRSDYIGVEFDFLQYLADQECQYWIDGQEKEAKEINTCYQAFMLEHIDSWVPRFCEQAEKEAETLFYSAALMITKGFVRQSCMDFLSRTGNEKGRKCEQ